jgi:hypothetical protein
LAVDETEVTFADFKALLLAAKLLKSNILQIFVFDAGGTFDFYDVPGVLSTRIENIHPREKAVYHESGFKKRASPAQQFPGAFDVSHKAFIGHLDAFREQFFCQISYQMSLVEDMLSRSVRRPDLVRLMENQPQIFQTLQPVHIPGL